MMPTHDDDLARLNVSQLARLTGFDRRTVRQRLAGLEPVERTGRELLYESRAALAQLYLSDSLDLSRERARLASEQADRIAMENAEARGEAMRWEDAEAFLLPIMSATAQRILAVPAKAAPEAHVALSLVACEAAIREPVHDALHDLAAVLSEGPPGLRRLVAAKAAERRQRNRQRPAPSIESSEGGERHAD
jgi:hypothetical protein